MRIRFLKPVLTLTLILGLLVAYPLYDWLADVRGAFIAGWVIGMVNTILGILVIELTIDRDNAIFMASFFGGMAVRVFMILLVFAFLLTEEFDAMTLTFSMMGFYFAYVVIEIRFLVTALSQQRGKRIRA